MRNRVSNCLYILAAVMVGCATPKPPELVEIPVPPGDWNDFEESKSGCPDTNGAYELVPLVATLQKDSSWEISSGNSYDFILLLPFARVIALKQDPDEISFPFSRNGLLFESSPDGSILRITNPVTNSKNYESHTLKTAEHDFECKAGSLIFPEFVIHGGTEGATLSGRVYRQATKTLSGDLMFYEQVRGYKTVHKYYLFKLKDS